MKRFQTAKEIYQDAVRKTRVIRQFFRLVITLV
jgi:hypothetical protein